MNAVKITSFASGEKSSSEKAGSLQKIKMETDEFVNECVTGMIQNQAGEMENGNINPLQMLFANIALSFAILPSCFPLSLFTTSAVDQIIAILQNLMTQIPNGERLPRIVYMNFEAGYCKVIAADVFTRNWIIDKISSLTFLDRPMMITSLANIPKCIYSTWISGNILDDAKILSRLNKQNESISTKRWNILAKDEAVNEFRVYFEVDAVSAYAIQSMDRIANFGMGGWNGLGWRE